MSAALERVTVSVNGKKRVAEVARRASHLTNAECVGCLKPAPLLMPVPVSAVYGETVWYLCRTCRLGWRDGHWIMLASTVAHLPNRAVPVTEVTTP